jgi:protein-tyrosine phosphatase
MEMPGLGRWSLDLDWLTPQLAVGGCYPIAAAEHLARALRVRCVVDLRVEDRDDERVLKRHGIELLHLPTQDGCAVSLPMLDEGVRWTGERLDAGARCLVHCQHGVGRSALLALCVLVARGEPPLRALEIAKGARGKISPSPEQLEAFRSWLARRRAAGAEVEIPGLTELAWIAYSHLREPEALGE